MVAHELDKRHCVRSTSFSAGKRTGAVKCALRPQRGPWGFALVVSCLDVSALRHQERSEPAVTSGGGQV